MNRPPRPTRAAPLAHGLVRDLNRARDRGRALALALAHARDRADNRALALDLELARELAIDLNSDLTNARDLNNALARDLNNARDLNSDVNLSRSRDLARDLNNARDLNSDLNNARDLNLSRSRDLTRDLNLSLDHALDLALALDKVLGSTPTTPAAHGVVGSAAVNGVSPVAERMVAGLMRLLPAENRSRYREEYTAELDELAKVGLSRWAQLGYAARVGTRVRSLRAALRADATGTRRA